MKNFFTLIELMMVVIIIAILAMIGFPTYRKAVLKARDREAQAMLKLIKEAERLYRLNYETFWSCTDTNDCNSDLGLDISSQYWNYKVPFATKDKFCAQADTKDSKQTLHKHWYISEAMDEPSTSGCSH